MTAGRMSPEELQARMEGSTPPFIIDVRTPDTYVRGHVPGARNIPLKQLQAGEAELPKERPIVTY